MADGAVVVSLVTALSFLPLADDPRVAAFTGLAPLLDPAEVAWQDRALCGQVGDDFWFPEKGGSTLEAKRVCGACEVRQSCLDYALDHDEKFGVWGGMSERERRRLRRDRPRSQPRRAKANTRPSSERPSRFPGVTWQGTRWTARWTPPGEARVYLGSFPSEEAAASAIEDARAAYQATQVRNAA